MATALPPRHRVLRNVKTSIAVERAALEASSTAVTDDPDLPLVAAGEICLKSYYGKSLSFPHTPINR